ncbi:hypothetical protein HHL16_02525 [Pseudoflavitalea sp. G-6-1-2]|uniref:hypothetical protein n=1 Tax=Pseudoflavitalea sp. G-6-1-2 TaxID=2728841 RepID=UPI00146F0999|nr:hypothetical protein [Pseudoflavitalea sp. G-6-1-2]NML19727.1 hypothetical protein [Pseudoflavitalea sp. G-6-1-2]
MLTKADIEKYFMAEKQAGLIVLIIGLVAIVLALVFFFALRTNLFKGAAVPLLLLGLMECAIGFSIYRKSDGDRIRNVYAYDMNPDQLRNEELPRMQKVEKHFVIYKVAELGFAIIGIVLIFLYKAQPEKSFWVGLGLTLLIQGVLLFGMETIAAQRAKVYTQKLAEWLTAPAQTRR